MLQCGVGRCVINPELGHHLAGYGREYQNTGVHDDLSVTALYLHDGNRDALLLNYDLIGMRLEFVRRLRGLVAKASGIPSEHIFLTNTHTHSAPDFYSYAPPDQPIPQHVGEYIAKLHASTCQAAVEAKRNAEPCTLHYNFTFAAENMNRRYSFPDRRFLYIPQNKQLAGESDGYVDRELGVVLFRKQGTPNRYKAVVTNYTCHPLCVGNSSNLCSADFQGVLRRVVEETFEGALCLSTTGAAGDNHPLLPEAGFARAEKMGSALGQLAVARAYDSVQVDYDTKLRLGYFDLTLKARDAETTRLLPEAADQQRAPRHTHKKVQSFKTCVGLLGVGPLLFVALPGELVSGLGATIKWSSPFLKTYNLFQATDNVGYIVSTNQYLWGGYEAVSSSLAKGSGEALVRKILESADSLLQKDPLHLPPREKQKVGY